MLATTPEGSGFAQTAGGNHSESDKHGEDEELLHRRDPNERAGAGHRGPGWPEDQTVSRSRAPVSEEG